MGVRSKEFHYKVGIRWGSERKGVLTAGGKPPIAVATPPEFKGHSGIWTPEDLFVAALLSCFMTTFLGTAYHRGLAFEGFEAEADGTLARPEGEFLFTEVRIGVRLRLPAGGDRALAREVLEFAKTDCLVSHSIVSEVKVEPSIVVAEEAASPAA